MSQEFPTVSLDITLKPSMVSITARNRQPRKSTNVRLAGRLKQWKWIVLVWFIRNVSCFQTMCICCVFTSYLGRILQPPGGRTMCEWDCLFATVKRDFPHEPTSQTTLLRARLLQTCRGAACCRSLPMTVIKTRKEKGKRKAHQDVKHAISTVHF